MDERDGLLSIAKIGEGSFGEVYRAQGGADAVILKLMPLNAQKGKGSRSFTSISSAKNEIRLLSRMSKVPGFVEFRGACVLQGRMPTQLIRQWHEYAVSGRTVESKDPNKKDSYAPTQLWLLIEMSDAGESLERGRYMPPDMQPPTTSKSKEPYLPARFAWDVFWQIAKALAKGEVFAMYEHRDLHLGNICVKDQPSDVRTYTFDSIFAIDNDSCAEADDPVRVYGINNSGIEVTLIDYSLSRASLGPDETLAYDFKNDKALLRGKGDLQYDMYRYMAAVVGKRASSEFVPRTNVMWLYYVLHLLLEATFPSDGAIETEMLDILTTLKGQLHPDKRDSWDWESAGDLIQTGLDSSWFLPAHVIDI
jgi:serine/threonine-protein kinase haspin